MLEPGLDRHEWETEWAALEEDFDADPAAGLRQAHDLMTRALLERRILDDERVANEGADPELVAPWTAARDLVRDLDAGRDVEEQDIREALESYREVLDTLLDERGAP